MPGHRSGPDRSYTGLVKRGARLILITSAADRQKLVCSVGGRPSRVEGPHGHVCPRLLHDQGLVGASGHTSH